MSNTRLWKLLDTQCTCMMHKLAKVLWLLVLELWVIETEEGSFI
jgi:hypothetical protein